jgi:hypothetical protein
MTTITRRILIVRCKTCDMDLDYKNAASTGLGALPPFHPNNPFNVFVRSIEPTPGKLTCPECRQTHDYYTEDIMERGI